MKKKTGLNPESRKLWKMKGPWSLKKGDGSNRSTRLGPVNLLL